MAANHQYHAEAKALYGSLKLPLEQLIPPEVSAFLPPKGGYLSQRAFDYRLEGVISYKSAHTQVSGMPGLKSGHGPATLVTSVVEGLNILEVLTCDRLVAQIATDHPLDGHVPTISFLGTRFENLRIAGHPVDVHLDIDMVGDKPAGDASYFNEAGFRSRVSKQCDTLRGIDGLPAEAFKRYPGVPTIGQDKDNKETQSLEFSLVSKTAFSDDHPVFEPFHPTHTKHPGGCYNHVIHVPNFGTIYLATVTITHEDYDKEIPRKTTVELTMIEAKLGCIGDGNVSAGSGKTNGNSGPGAG